MIPKPLHILLSTYKASRYPESNKYNSGYLPPLDNIRHSTNGNAVPHHNYLHSHVIRQFFYTISQLTHSCSPFSPSLPLSNKTSWPNRNRSLLHRTFPDTSGNSSYLPESHAFHNNHSPSPFAEQTAYLHPTAQTNRHESSRNGQSLYHSAHPDW